MTPNRLREVLRYDPKSGVFTWIAATSARIRVGDRAGTISTKGYRRIKIDGRLYRAHRLAWLYMTSEWPAEKIDHKNGEPDDNRFDNLREATTQQNGFNRRLNANSTSGFKGVHWFAPTQKWCARIGVGNNRKFLGLFDDPAKAHAAYCEAAARLFGEFARNG